ncbi:MAG: hypothetical protein ACPG9K_01015 [Poseidonibacter sp.]
MNRLTNKEGISIPLAVWLAHDDYDYDGRDNVISTTTLLKPIRQIVLGRKYKDAMREIDVSDLIASSMGTALHDSVEAAWMKKDKVIKTLESLGYSKPELIFDKLTLEKRSEKEFGKYIVSGKFDIAFDGTVCDIKSTSVWSYIYGSKEKDYILQMSIYRLLNPSLITHDFGYIEYIFTDWSAVKAKQDSSYPQSRVLSKKLKLLSLDETEKYISEKLALVAKYEAMGVEDLLVCPDDELWREADVWKYYKNPKSMSRATKNFDNELDANARLSKDKNVGIVVHHKGGVKRCQYCNYTNLCSQYYEMQIKGEIK